MFRWAFCSFRIKSDLKATGIENLGQISHLFTPLNLTEGWTKCLNELETKGPTYDSLLTGGSRRSGKLEVSWYKKDSSTGKSDNIFYAFATETNDDGRVYTRDNDNDIHVLPSLQPIEATY